MATKQQQKDSQAIADVNEILSSITIESATVVSDESVVHDTFDAKEIAVTLQGITDRANKSIAKELYAKLNGMDESKSAREIAREWLNLPASNAPKDNVDSLTEWMVTQAMAYRVVVVLNANKSGNDRTTFEKCVRALNNGTKAKGITKGFAKSCAIGDELPDVLKLTPEEIASPQARKTKSVDEKINDDLDNLFKHLAMGDLNTWSYVNVQLMKRMKDSRALLESNAIALKS